MYTFSIKSGSILAQNRLQKNVLFVEFELNFSQSFPVSAGSNSLISRASLLFFQSRPEVSISQKVAGSNTKSTDILFLR